MYHFLKFTSIAQNYKKEFNGRNIWRLEIKDVLLPMDYEPKRKI